MESEQKEEPQAQAAPEVEDVAGAMYDPEKIRVLNHKLLVKLDPSPEVIGSIIVPNGSYTRSECWATVVNVGTGVDTRKGRVPIDLKKGDRVLVIRMHELTSSNKGYQAMLGKGYVFLDYPDDILLVQEE